MDDFIGIESQFSDEESLIQETVRRFVTNKAAPLFAAAYEPAEFPRQIIHDLAELGIIGMTLPVEYGGSAASYVSYGIVCGELEYADSALRSFVSVQTSLCMYPIFCLGTEQQRKHFLPKMAKGELIGCFGLTEPDAVQTQPYENPC